MVAVVVSIGAFSWWIEASRSVASPDRVHPFIVMLRPGPAAEVGDAEMGPVGFDPELARLFATEHNFPLRFEISASDADLRDAVASGRVHAGAGGLHRPLRPDAATEAEDPRLLWTRGTYSAQPVLIFPADSARPAGWRDLAGERVYVGSASSASALAATREAHPEVAWRAIDAPADALIAQVSAGEIPYAIVESDAAAVARNVYLGFDVAFAAGDARDFAWLVPRKLAALHRELDDFVAKLSRDGTLARLVARYFATTAQLPQVDAGALRERVQTLLPPLRALFRGAQEATGIEWRLLAAIAYQESQWDPLATSETGVRGIMQLTADTAKELGDIDRLDPRASILAAARYLRDLKDRLPQRIGEPDRTWLALAAFNIGFGHLEDARVLAQRGNGNPDLWSEVRKVLPLLALPEYYADAKLGYARGGMPVAFVDRVRAYYDVLLATQPPHQPRLRLSVRRAEPSQ